MSNQPLREQENLERVMSAKKLVPIKTPSKTKIVRGIIIKLGGSIGGRKVEWITDVEKEK